MVDILGTTINSNMRIILSLSSFLVSFVLSLLLTKLHYSFGTLVLNIILYIVIHILAVLVYQQLNTSSTSNVKESFGNKLCGEEGEAGEECEEENTQISNIFMEQEETEQIATEMENRNNSLANVAMNSNSPLTMDEINAYSEEIINNEETSLNNESNTLIENDNNNIVLTKSTLDYMLKTPVNVTVNLNASELCNNDEPSSNNNQTNNNQTNNNESGTNDGNMFSNIDMNTVANYTLDKQQNYINEYRNSQKCPVCPLIR